MRFGGAPRQRVDVITALQSMTIWPAWQHCEEDRKGMIGEGNPAFFVLLSEYPTAMDPKTLSARSVALAIKEGAVTCERKGELRKTEAPAPFIGHPAPGRHFLATPSEGMSNL